MVVFFTRYILAESKRYFPRELPGDLVLLEIKTYPRDFFWNILVAQNQIWLKIRQIKKNRYQKLNLNPVLYYNPIKKMFYLHLTYSIAT